MSWIQTQLDQNTLFDNNVLINRLDRRDLVRETWTFCMYIFRVENFKTRGNILLYFSNLSFIDVCLKNVTIFKENLTFLRQSPLNWPQND